MTVDTPDLSHHLASMPVMVDVHSERLVWYTFVVVIEPFVMNQTTVEGIQMLIVALLGSTAAFQTSTAAFQTSAVANQTSVAAFQMLIVALLESTAAFQMAVGNVVAIHRKMDPLCRYSYIERRYFRQKAET